MAVRKTPQYTKAYWLIMLAKDPERWQSHGDGAGDFVCLSPSLLGHLKGALHCLVSLTTHESLDNCLSVLVRQGNTVLWWNTKVTHSCRFLSILTVLCEKYHWNILFILKILIGRKKECRDFLLKNEKLFFRCSWTKLKTFPRCKIYSILKCTNEHLQIIPKYSQVPFSKLQQPDRRSRAESALRMLWLLLLELARLCSLLKTTTDNEILIMLYKEYQRIKLLLLLKKKGIYSHMAPRTTLYTHWTNKTLYLHSI